MAVIRNSQNAMMVGKVGAISYLVRQAQQIARQALNNSNYGKTARRTEAQQARRVKWPNCVNFYKVSKGWMPKAYETLKKGQTDYNRFMQLNVSNSIVSLSKDMAAAGACIAEPFLISQGSIPSIEVSQNANKWTTNIAVGGLVIDENTTVGEFSINLVNNNKRISIGMQLSFISYMQNIDALGVPRLICTPYEVTLSSDNTDKLRDYLPEFCSSVTDGYLSTSDQIAVGAFAYVLSSLQDNKLTVSTQRLITNNAALLHEYSSEENTTRAINSYGVDSEVMLSPISSVLQDGVQKPLFIEYLLMHGDKKPSRSYIGTAEYIFNGNPQLVLSYAIDRSDIDAVTFDTTQDLDIAASIISVEKNVIGFVSIGPAPTNIVTKIKLLLNNGTVLEINFSSQGDEVG